MMQSREELKKIFELSRSKVFKLPYLARELSKAQYSNMKIDTLSAKYREQSIEILTQSFMKQNTLSQTVGINAINKQDYNDFKLLSTNKIDHAILTGLSLVIILNDNIVLAIGIYYDEFDLPPKIPISSFQSEAVKMRILLINEFENNDKWLQKIHNKENSKYNNFGRVMNGAYGCRNFDVAINSNHSNFIDIGTRIMNMIIYDMGYDYVHFTQTHKITIKYAKLIELATNNNKNIECNGLCKCTNVWNFSKYPLFIEYMKSMNDNKLNTNSINLNDCILAHSYRNMQIIKNLNWDLNKYWIWLMYTLPKLIGIEYLKQKTEKQNENTKITAKL